ncbi:hypothetical protein EYC84_011854 [Monilinia fructicola]|uniref:Uncharacterized protein n=1 Tax=Monilinia fructicola TaxID=38448 RepID=A0A5M9J7I5_MONFR|nr:hypothetical protein EYC84_011854 [Monilinia fructicola]
MKSTHSHVLLEARRYSLLLGHYRLLVSSKGITFLFSGKWTLACPFERSSNAWLLRNLRGTYRMKSDRLYGIMLHHTKFQISMPAHN